MPLRHRPPLLSFSFIRFPHHPLEEPSCLNKIIRARYIKNLALMKGRDQRSSFAI